MKILEIIPQLGSGGAERFTVDLCNELVKSNDVTLVVFHSLEKHGFYKNELSSGIKLISLNKRMGVDITIPFKLLHIIIDQCPDIVHTHIGGIDYAFLSSFFYRKPKYFHTIHSDAKKESTGGIKRIIRKISFKTRLFTPITISPSSEKSFQDFYGFKGHMIYNGRRVPKVIEVDDAVKEEFIEYKKRGRVLTLLARFVPVKRHLLIAKIAKRLYDNGYNFTLLMIGNQTFESIAEEVKRIAPPNVYLLGQKQNPLAYLSMSDAYCLCSEYEGMPISLIEAMACGAVPICTPVGGITDVVRDGDNGLLSEDLTEETYMKALVKFLQMSDEELNCLKNRTIKSSEPFKMEECADKYIKLFKINTGIVC